MFQAFEGQVVRPCTRGISISVGKAIKMNETTGVHRTDYWFVTPLSRKRDLTSAFLTERVWRNARTNNKERKLVMQMRKGDRIALKTELDEAEGIRVKPLGNAAVSIMRIHAIGIITESAKDCITVKVAWDDDFEPRDWYFYTYINATGVVRVDQNKEAGKRLIEFCFHKANQDLSWFLKQPGWRGMYALP